MNREIKVVFREIYYFFLSCVLSNEEKHRRADAELKNLLTSGEGIMTPREIKAVSEAIEKLGVSERDAEEFAQAAIAASDSQYLKGLVEALKEIAYNDDMAQIIAKKALQQLPEDLR
jgi:hypothetical protein